METKQDIRNKIWVEKFRPSTIDDTLLPKTMKTFFKKILKEKDFPNLLFYSSSPGVGKTTVAKALCKEAGIEYMYINTSSESGIDILRTKITKFASAKSLFSRGGAKVVILDEFDGASRNLQEALRAAIEEFSNSCRFILTANFVTKIIEPLKSRLQSVSFNMTEAKTSQTMIPDIQVRLKGMLDFENVEYKDDVLKKLIEGFYPDIRKMINVLQQYSNTYGIIDKNIFNYETIDDEFYDFILNRQLTNARKYLIEKNYNWDELYTDLFHNLIPKLPQEKQGECIIAVAEYMYRNAFVVDKEINATACLLELISAV